MTLISSQSNPKVKQARLLKQRKGRQESGSFLVEGIFPVGEAAAAAAAGRLVIEMIFYAPERLHSEFARGLLDEQEQAGVPCYATTQNVFETIAEKDNPQGILAVARLQTYSLDDLHPVNFPWGVAAIAPQDPGNVGAILRTVDAVGASGLILLDSSVDALHPGAVRASMGALFWHPVVSTSFAAFSNWCGKHNYHLYGTSAHAENDYRRAGSYQRPCILLLGSEREGLTVEQAARCEKVIRLPMHGRVTSLNLAVSAGVMLYAMLEQMD